jgi:hypothetical protein
MLGSELVCDFSVGWYVGNIEAAGIVRSSQLRSSCQGKGVWWTFRSGTSQYHSCHFPPAKLGKTATCWTSYISLRLLFVYIIAVRQSMPKPGSIELGVGGGGRGDSIN